MASRMALAAALCVLVLLFLPLLHTIVQLDTAKARGVYATPEDGMRALCVKNPYAVVTQIEIVSAGEVFKP
jgi:hypothetical protein